ncbi:MAG: OmpH family outer membrane protein [Gammaproteobacteria bacterium]|nr:OmpH family outer membrane protein [Gammaproteobacteria bacterium]
MNNIHKNNAYKYGSVVLVLLLVAMVLSGCNKSQAIATTAVIDLDKVAVATGRDKLINQRVQEFAEIEEDKLNKLKAELVTEINKTREQLGDKPSEEDARTLADMTRRSDARLKQAIARVEDVAGRLKINLVVDFRNEVEPVVRQVAQADGFKLVVIKSPEYLFIDSSADITDAVIDKLLAMKTEAKTSPSASAEPNEKG